MLYIFFVRHALASVHYCLIGSPAGKGLTAWLLFVMFNCVIATFPCGILGQVWYLIVSIPDLCHLCYYKSKVKANILKYCISDCNTKAPFIF